MKHKFSLIWRVAVALVLVLSFSLVAAVPAAAAAPTTVWVDDDADPSWYDSTHVLTIQGGIDVVAVGGTVNVEAGTYSTATNGETFPININKASLTLKSTDGPATTIIEGVGDNAYGLINIDAADVVLGGSDCGFTIKVTSGTTPNGVFFAGACTEPTVQGNVITGALSRALQTVGGISGLSMTIKDNTFTSTLAPGACSTGHLYTKPGSLIDNNEISGFTIGISLYGSGTSGSWTNPITVSNNRVHGNTGEGIALDGGSATLDYVLISGNDVYGNADGIAMCGTHLDNVKVACNNLYHNTNAGLQIYSGVGHPDHVYVYGNNIYGNTTYGINNGTGTEVPAEDNWWGSVDGPGDATGTNECKVVLTTLTFTCDTVALMKNAVGENTGTLGNSVTVDNVDYCPWLLATYSGPAITSPTIDYVPGAIAARPDDVVTVSATATESTTDVTLSAATEIFDGMTEVDGTFTVVLTDTDTDTENVYDADLTVLDVPDGSYPLTITATGTCDEEVIDESLSLEVKLHVTTVEVELYEGWNLMSLPLIPDDSDITVVISDDTLASGDVSSVGSVRGYDPATGTTGTFPSYEPGVGGDLTIMEDGYGYWVFMDAADTLTVTGTVMPVGLEVPPSYDVVEGWNLIGFKSVADVDDSDTYLLNLTELGYSVLWSYDAETEAYTNVKGSTMKAGHGFWLWATEDGTIVPTA